MANPFYKATTDSEWKEMCKFKLSASHYYQFNYPVILHYRRYNELLNEFKKFYIKKYL